MKTQVINEFLSFTSKKKKSHEEIFDYFFALKIKKEFDFNDFVKAAFLTLRENASKTSYRAAFEVLKKYGINFASVDELKQKFLQVYKNHKGVYQDDDCEEEKEY